MKLGGIATAMVTPFGEDGSVDVMEAARIAEWLVERGNDGLVVAGTTGEGQTLTVDERMALFKAVKSAVGDQATVIGNCGTNDTHTSVAFVHEVAAEGVDAILAVVPYYNKPTQEGMLAHFGAIAQACELPIIIYNIPSRTGVNMLPETLLELAKRHKNIRGVKESSGDLSQFTDILRERPNDFVFYCGDDHLFLPSLALGADGVIGVATHFCALEFQEMAEALRAGRTAEAAAIHFSLVPLFKALFATSNPIAVKWAMQELGFSVGEPRLPLGPMPKALKSQLAPLLRRYKESVPV
jgi:4-hydroxy-tetrahydrodipicolinate synthase